MKKLIFKHAAVTTLAFTFITFTFNTANAQPQLVRKKPLKEILASNGIQLDSTLRGPVVTSLLKKLNLYDKFRLGNQPSKPVIAPSETHPVVHQPKTATVNSIRYTLQSTPLRSTGSNALSSRNTVNSRDKLTSCDVSTYNINDWLNKDGALNIFSSFDNVWPGAIYTDQSVVTGSFQRSGVSRNPLKLTTDLMDYSTENSDVVETVQNANDQSQVNQAVARLLNNNRHAQKPAMVNSDVMSFNAFGQASIELSTHAALSANLESILEIPVKGEIKEGGSFSSSVTTSYNKVYATLVQPFYYVSVANNHPSDMVRGNASADLVFVKSVLYGRAAIISAEGSEASAEIETALNSIIKASLEDVASASLENRLSATAKAMLRNQKIKVFIYGGSARMANAVAVGGLDEFKRYVRGMSPSVNRAGGVPIAYTFRYVADDAPVYIQAVTNYQTAVCTRNKVLRVMLDKLVATKVVDAPSIWGADEEIFGTVDISLKYKDDNGSWKTLSPVEKGNGNNDGFIWKKTINNAIKIKEGAGNGESLNKSSWQDFIVNDKITQTLKIEYEVKMRDKIEDIEWILTSEFGKKNHYVKYVDLKDYWTYNDINPRNGIKYINLNTNEDDAKLQVRFGFDLRN